ncbi:MAG: hypothetical protein AAFP67_13715 [Pseudomonadota bacterium]
MRIAWPESLAGTAALVFAGFALMVGAGVWMMPGSATVMFAEEAECAEGTLVGVVVGPTCGGWAASPGTGTSSEIERTD